MRATDRQFAIYQIKGLHAEQAFATESLPYLVIRATRLRPAAIDAAPVSVSAGRLCSSTLALAMLRLAFRLWHLIRRRRLARQAG